MNFTLLLLASALLFNGSYRGLILDASTGEPLRAVSVRRILDGQRYEGHLTLLSNGYGRFGFEAEQEADSVHLRLSARGYASAEITRPMPSAGQVDTLWLMPLSGPRR